MKFRNRLVGAPVAGHWPRRRGSAVRRDRRPRTPHPPAVRRSPCRCGGSPDAVEGHSSRTYEKEHPGIKMQTKISDYDASHQTLLTALAAGNGPDIAQIAIDYMAEFVAHPAGLHRLADVRRRPDQVRTTSTGAGTAASRQTAKAWSGFRRMSVGWPWPTARTCSPRRVCRPIRRRSAHCGRPGTITSLLARSTSPRPTRSSLTAARRFSGPNPIKAT